jgi:hypothetical protein
MFRFDPGFPAGGWHLVLSIQCLLHFLAVGGITVRVGRKAVVWDAFFRKTSPFCVFPRSTKNWGFGFFQKQYFGTLFQRFLTRESNLGPFLFERGRYHYTRGWKKRIFIFCRFKMRFSGVCGEKKERARV